LTASPVALCVSEVDVGGAVVVFVGAGGGIVVEVDVGGELPALEPVPVGEAGTVDVGELGVVETPGRAPSVKGADFVWKASMPPSPAMVAPITIGVRLIECVVGVWILVFVSYET
jgi:hypothetical protein